MKLKFLSLFFLIYILCAGIVLSVDTHYTDNLLSKVKSIKPYRDKIEFLQSEIRKINTTQFGESIELAKYGITLAKENQDRINEGEFLRNIGGAYMKMGKSDSASVYYYQALNLLKNSKSEFLGLLYDDMARMYRKFSDFDRALKFYDSALVFYESSNDLEGIARINNESGIVFQEMGELETAFNRYKKSLDIQTERNDSVGMGYALEFMGQNKMLTQEYNKAKEYLIRSMEIRSKLPDKFALMLSYTSLGGLFKEIRDYVTSNRYFEKSNEIAREIKFPDIQEYNYSQIETNFFGLNNFEKAYSNLKKQILIKDSLYEISKIKTIEDVSTQYETAEKEKEILEQRATLAEKELSIQKSKYYISLLILFILFMLLLAYLLFSRQKLKLQKFQNEAELKETQLKLESNERLQRERLRISRDLHDNIGTQLTFIISAVDNLGFGLSEENQKIKQKLLDIKSFASGTISELRDTIWAMNSISLSLDDLLARVANHVEKANQFHDDISVQLSVDPKLSHSTQFTTIQGLNIYRILQEAVHNALKYSNASLIDISINDDNGLLFSVSDNGIGFNENEVELGNGIYNMKKRALDLGSELLLLSDKNEGTSVKFKINKN